MKNISPFDSFAYDYDLWFENNRSLFLTELELIRQMDTDKCPKLEIGVGTGRFAVELETEYGVEPSLNMSSFASKRGVTVINAVGEELPFKDKVFGTIFIITTLCFLNSPAAVFSECRRVLYEKGELILAFIEKSSFLGRFYESRKNENKFYRDALFYTTEEVVEMLSKKGFSDIAVFDITNKMLAAPSSASEKLVGSFIGIRAVK